MSLEEVQSSSGIKVSGRPSKPFKINIYERFYNAIAKSSSFRDDGKIHVSELTHPCMRHAYYDRISTEHSHSIKTMLTFWIGRKLHETSVFEHHEFPVEWGHLKFNLDNGKTEIRESCEKIKVKRDETIITVYASEIEVGDEIDVSES